MQADPINHLKYSSDLDTLIFCITKTVLTLSNLWREKAILSPKKEWRQKDLIRWRTYKTDKIK